MISTDVKNSVKNALVANYFDDIDDYVYVGDSSFPSLEEGIDPTTETNDDYLFVLVISPKLSGKWVVEKQELLSSLLFQHLPKSIWSKVSRSTALAPEELRDVL